MLGLEDEINESISEIRNLGGVLSIERAKSEPNVILIQLNESPKTILKVEASAKGYKVRKHSLFDKLILRS
jgi:hypothetical protein